MNKAWLTACIAGCALATSVHAQVVSYVIVNNHRFLVEVADDEFSRQQGLMHRERLDDNRGMLFLFDEEAPLAFWMKNTLIPLDILYFDKSGSLVSIQQNVQPCKADPCPVYPSGVPASQVLEINGGLAAKLGIKPGDKAEIHR